MKRLARTEGPWLLASFAFTAAFFIIAVLAMHDNPFHLLELIWHRVLTSPYGMGQILYRATTLIFTGLGCALAFRCGLFNIGAEGQLYIGAFLMTWLGLELGSLPSALLLPICLAGAAVGGALWALLPALLKARRGAHEVITTMMMNFVALALTNYLISWRFHVPETVHTAEMSPHAALPLAAAFEHWTQSSSANASVLIAVALAFAVKYFLWNTPRGFELRAVGLNLNASRTSGIPVERRFLEILLLSGAVSGLAGMNFILGYKHYFEAGFASGAGFLGIAVALVAKNHPVGVIFSALLFAFLSQAGLTLNGSVPKELFEILQGAIILIVVICQNRFGGES